MFLGKSDYGLLLSGVRGEENGHLLDQEDLDLVDKQVSFNELGFQQIESLEKIMKLVREEKSSFDLDHALIQKALHRAHSLALSTSECN